MNNLFLFYLAIYIFPMVVVGRVQGKLKFLHFVFFFWHQSIIQSKWKNKIHAADPNIGRTRCVLMMMMIRTNA